MTTANSKSTTQIVVKERESSAYVITTVLLPFTPPITLTRGISALTPIISIFMGFPSN